MDVTQVALSGLGAAEKRLANSANNIVNARTPGYPATDAEQTALNGGGVKVEIVARDPATVKQAGENGAEDVPNVSLEEEVVNGITAGYDYQANLKILKVQKELDKSLLDIQA